jgi:aryl-alcohol dehydrogenase-like predicted oxidoreductase
MEYTILGDSGIRVSQYCLGTMTFGHGTQTAEAQKIVSAALDRGVTFFDTADAYSQGEAEIMLSKSLGARRKNVVLATKFSNPTGGWPNDSGWSNIHIKDAVEQSLKRLGTDYIDIYYVHHTDSTTSMERLLRSLDNLVRQGKIRSYACSNFEAWRLSDMYWIGRQFRVDKPVCYQGAYSLVMRDMESEVLPYCRDKEIGVVAFWVLAAGFLTGKYQPGEKSAENSRSAENWSFPYEHFAPNADDVLSALIAYSRQLSVSPAYLAMEWVRNNPAVNSVLFGARTPQQLEDSLRFLGKEIDPQILRQLDAISKPSKRYPYWMEEDRDEMRRDAVTCGRT